MPFEMYSPFCSFKFSPTTINKVLKKPRPLSNDYSADPMNIKRTGMAIIAKEQSPNTAIYKIHFSVEVGYADNKQSLKRLYICFKILCHISTHSRVYNIRKSLSMAVQ